MLKGLLLKFYYFVTDEKRVDFARKIDKVLRRIGGKTYVKTLGQIKYKMRFGKMIDRREEPFTRNLYWDCERREIRAASRFLVSILMPRYEQKGISSELQKKIKQQSYKNFEVLQMSYGLNEFNDFMKEGLLKAKGELIWIVKEGQNYKNNFLEKIVPLFEYESVRLGICKCKDSDWEWGKSVFMTATEFVTNILNKGEIDIKFGGMIFRKSECFSRTAQSYIKRMNVYGEAIWMLDTIRGGLIGYVDTTESYCDHGDATVSPDERICDIKLLTNFAMKHYSVNADVFKRYQQNLREKYYSDGEMLDISKSKMLNIVMICYAIKTGGGEVYPIILANELKRQGCTITIVNLNLEEREDKIAQLIDASIPVVNLRHTDLLGEVLHDLNADIVHSHHATADYAVALWMAAYHELGRHIITLHGMYEAINDIDCTRVINATQKSAYKYIYIADKNLSCFKQRNAYDEQRFIKLPNGLPRMSVVPIERERFGIGNDDFVFVLASRGIPEKGWREAINAIRRMNERSGRKTHLMILGDGEMRRKLETDSPEYIHFVGMVNNVREYFAMGDAGILPTWYKGESYPLAISECLSVGKPVLATSLAEIPNQIRDENGNMAGLLVPLRNGILEESDLYNAIYTMVNDKRLYESLKSNAISASKKNDIERIAQEHLKVYKEACAK